MNLATTKGNKLPKCFWMAKLTRATIPWIIYFFSITFDLFFFKVVTANLSLCPFQFFFLSALTLSRRYNQQPRVRIFTMPPLNKMLVLRVVLVFVAFLGFTKCQDLPSKYITVCFEYWLKIPNCHCQLGHHIVRLMHSGVWCHSRRWCIRYLMFCSSTCKGQHRATPGQPDLLSWACSLLSKAVCIMGILYHLWQIILAHCSSSDVFCLGNTFNK